MPRFELPSGTTTAFRPRRLFPLLSHLLESAPQNRKQRPIFLPSKPFFDLDQGGQLQDANTKPFRYFQSDCPSDQIPEIGLCLQRPIDPTGQSGHQKLMPPRCEMRFIRHSFVVGRVGPTLRVFQRGEDTFHVLRIPGMNEVQVERGDGAPSIAAPTPPTTMDSTSCSSRLRKMAKRSQGSPCSCRSSQCAHGRLEHRQAFRGVKESIQRIRVTSTPSGHRFPRRRHLMLVFCCPSSQDLRIFVDGSILSRSRGGLRTPIYRTPADGPT